MNYFIIIAAGLLLNALTLKGQNRWELMDDGGIKWQIAGHDAHTDHLEMSGKQVSVIVTYGTSATGEIVSSKQLVFPMLRTIPNDTRGNVIYTFGTDIKPIIKVNGRVISEKPKHFYIKGMLESVADVGQEVTLTRTLVPSTDYPLVIERFKLINQGSTTVNVEIEDFEKHSRTPAAKSVYGVYQLSATAVKHGIYAVQPKDSIVFSMVFSGGKAADLSMKAVDFDNEIEKRQQLVSRLMDNLRFESPDPVLNRMFDFAKIRSMESIFETKGGLVHSPGGANYYAAIWANDQAEYANPFFAYTGNETAIASAMTSWRWFSEWMNPTYEPIPSSIIAEGEDFWNGAGDRGDQAMIAYGATRFALALGDEAKAKSIWPLIEWCIEYSRRKINTDGVVESDSDELEGRFPAGRANLNTSCLLYDALLSAHALGEEIGVDRKLLKQYKVMARDLRQAIIRHFASTVQGYETFRYYEGNDVLRSWICTPLTVDIFERSSGTIDALFSPLLWTEDGLLTQSGTETFWDRSTLYGLRGAFAAGAIRQALPHFVHYSNRRLLGDHVPYAVEAWPEGNQRHLSAESVLYCRVVTEGLFGFRPNSLTGFSIRPQLPDEWPEMALKNIVAFGGQSFDINVRRAGKLIYTEVKQGNHVVFSKSHPNGAAMQVTLTHRR